jgi:hypothetical protein
VRGFGFLLCFATLPQEVRQKLFDELSALNADRDFSFLLRQVGMFSFTGLSPAQVRACAHLLMPIMPFITGKSGRGSSASGWSWHCACKGSPAT